MSAEVREEKVVGDGRLGSSEIFRRSDEFAEGVLGVSIVISKNGKLSCEGDGGGVELIRDLSFECLVRSKFEACFYYFKGARTPFLGRYRTTTLYCDWRYWIFALASFLFVSRLGQHNQTSAMSNEEGEIRVEEGAVMETSNNDPDALSDQNADSSFEFMPLDPANNAWDDTQLIEAYENAVDSYKKAHPTRNTKRQSKKSNIAKKPRLKSRLSDATPINDIANEKQRLIGPVQPTALPQTKPIASTPSAPTLPGPIPPPMFIPAPTQPHQSTTPSKLQIPPPPPQPYGDLTSDLQSLLNAYFEAGYRYGVHVSSSK